MGTISAIVNFMSIVMVKKILLDGSPCAKCTQAEEILQKRGHQDRIDRIVFAQEGDDTSEGMKLAAKFNIHLAPFFIVEEENSPPRIYTRVFEFIKKELDIASNRLPTEIQDADITAAAVGYAAMEPQEILADAQKTYGSELTLAFSGAEDVILIDMASRNKLPFSVFCLDTGRLHPETYRFIDVVRDRYGIAIEIFVPSPQILEPFIQEKGLTSFYRDGHGECCGIRKVEPLKRALANRRAWATGLRRDQSPATRSNLSPIERDSAHLDPKGMPLVKINPLLEWTSERVWDYIRDKDVPYNALHDMGYRSIGCEPCTRPSRPGEHERMARWWWEEATGRECGLHLK